MHHADSAAHEPKYLQEDYGDWDDRSLTGTSGGRPGASTSRNLKVVVVESNVVSSLCTTQPSASALGQFVFKILVQKFNYLRASH